MNICHCYWFKKEVDWPIAELDKIRQVKQRIMGKKGWSQKSCQQMHREARWACCVKKEKTKKNHVTKHSLKIWANFNVGVS